jgi:hypothetical protein
LTTILGWSVSSVAHMTESWALSLSIDAQGHDDTQVSIAKGVGGGGPHLKVRTGPVLVHCLGPAAAMSAAQAWASARLAAMSWLPPLEDRRGPAPTPSAGLGAAIPCASLIFDGRQPWHVERVGPAMSITVGPLQVIARDATALDTHIRAWTEASAVAARLFPGRAVPFSRLIEHERIAQLRALDQKAEQRRRRRRPSLPVPPTSERTGRGDGGNRGRE